MADRYTNDLPETASPGTPTRQVVQATPVCNPDGTFIGSSGGGGGTTVADQGAPGADPWPVSGPLTDAQLRAAAVAVSGPLTNAQLVAVTGAASVAPWEGSGNGTAIAILKAIWSQNEDIKTLLTTIAANTTPAGG